MIDTTVIIIKGKSHQILLKDIADALTKDLVKKEPQKPRLRQKSPYHFKVEMPENQRKTLKKFIGKKNTLRFEEVRDFLIQNFNQKYHNKTISSELQTNGFTRILINSGENNRDGIKAIWIRA